MNQYLTIPLIFFLLLPSDRFIDRVDLIEINHFYDGNGRLVLDQIVFYDFNSFKSEYECIDWRLIKNGRKKYSKEELFKKKVEILKSKVEKPPFVPEWIGCSEVPLYNRRNRMWVSRFYDYKDRKYRVVQSTCYRETWTLVDVELANREIFPRGQRRELTNWLNMLKRKREILK